MYSQAIKEITSPANYITFIENYVSLLAKKKDVVGVRLSRLKVCFLSNFITYLLIISLLSMYIIRRNILILGGFFIN